MDQSQYKVSLQDPMGQANLGDNIGEFFTIQQQQQQQQQMQALRQTIPGHLQIHRGDRMQRIPAQQTPDNKSFCYWNFTNQIQIGGKDLIIRMLAEVFHVDQGHDGQVRWQQVSTSLVPISLYSRTTSKWLDYLLTASSLAAANDPANAMSPDSREFLMLMQQFHSNQKQTSNGSSALNNNNSIIAQHNFQVPKKSPRNIDIQAQSQDDHIVFQIVGHDFINGQCKRILNVKIVQPGTRLGQASDYFVYWKEQPTQIRYEQNRLNHLRQMQNQFSSSIASTTSFSQPPGPLMNQQFDSGQTTGRWLIVGPSEGESHTWGLNFASINDAKLFYDICSLNLVDLDFNSEYLKQLALNDKLKQQYRTSNLKTPAVHRVMISPQSTASTANRQNIRQKSSQKRSQRQTIVTGGVQSKQHTQQSVRENKCPACCTQTTSEATRALLDTHLSSAMMNGNLPANQLAEVICPLHSVYTNSKSTNNKRSRSTTRTKDCDPKDGLGSRARSFSTPASPDGDCPVHRTRIVTDSECDQDQKRTRILTSSATNRSKLPPFQQYPTVVPKKSAKSSFKPSIQRDRTTLTGSRHHHEAMMSDQALHSMKTTKTRYQGYLHSLGQQQSTSLHQDSRAQEELEGSYALNFGATSSKYNAANPLKYVSVNQSSQETQAMGHYRSNQEDEFGSAHRDVRLARAQYANSKNMKEFLSLDAGGFQPMQNQHWMPRQQFGKQTSQSSNKTLVEEAKQRSQRYSKKKEKEFPLHKLNQDDKNSRRQTSTNGSSIQRIQGKTRSIIQGATENQTQRPDFVCNASTTTEDLPMDAQTRERILKLASEDVISEQTEPKSFSATNQISRDPQKQTSQRDERQVRAVSLGPEVHRASSRGRGARSDAGRRRSLERSMCVDLDSTLPASSFLKFARLSPLAQSTVPKGLDSGRNPAGDFISSAEQHQDLAGPHGNYQHDLTKISLNGSNNKLAQHGQELLQDSGLTKESVHGLQSDDNQHQTLPFNRNNVGTTTTQLNEGHKKPLTQEQFEKPQLACDKSRQMVQKNGNESMSAFKSSPDIRQLSNRDHHQQQQAVLSNCCLNSDNIARVRYGNMSDELDGYNYGDDLVINESKQRRRQRLDAELKLPHQIAAGHETMPKRASALSSYAIPLCMSTRQSRQQQLPERLCRSCPNSLRREKRFVSRDASEYNHFENCSNTAETNGFSLRANQFVSDFECSCQHRGQISVYDRSRFNHTTAHLPNKHSSSHHNHIYEEQRTIPNRDQGCSHHFYCHHQPLGGVNYQGNSCHCNVIVQDQVSAMNKCQECDSIYENTTPPRIRQSHKMQELAPCHHSHHSHSYSQQYHQHCNYPSRRRTTHEQTLNDRPLVQSTSFTNARQLNNASQSNLRDCSAQSRPNTSQGNRSPLHYGLYDSESGDEEVEEICRQSNFLHEQECYPGPSFNRSTSVFFRSNMRPVQGYDQTLSRASLRSRQRSKSQPPAGEVIGELYSEDQNTLHLTKSKENVEKLIREVQNELNALRRQPLGTALIDMKRSSQDCSRKFADSNLLSRPTPSKMSLQEQEEGARNQHTCDIAPDQPEAAEGLSKISMTSATRRAGQFKCAGAIRKAGFLSVKKWILKRRQSIELARRQGWKRYWVCLRGTALLFHSVIDKKLPIGENCQKTSSGELNNDNPNGDNYTDQHTDLLSWIQANFPNQMGILTNLFHSEQFAHQDQPKSRDSFLRSMSQCYIESEPKHLIIIDGAIAQPMPEHPRRDFVFCLSTTFGDAYFFQASCQPESDNWISAIHNACAASIARDLTREETVKLFINKIRHLELEAEKKLFLRQRLESRLTSMLSMSGGDLGESLSMRRAQLTAASCNQGEGDNKKVTMRSLLYQLSQQLLALDSYIERVHCEIYQLRCYLSSCSAQYSFYQSIQPQDDSTRCSTLTNELPNPKSLLMHVSKPTKLLLLKMGVFTVSSFHAFIHACHGGAERILQRLQSTHDPEQTKTETLELRIRSQSISDSILEKRENTKLENETEDLIELSNLRTVRLQLTKVLFNKIKRSYADGLRRVGEDYFADFEADTSDDRYSIRDGGETIIINLKLNPNTNSLAIIKQVLKIIESKSNELDFLDYYLKLVSTDQKCKGNQALPEEDNCVAKWRETLNDWSSFNYIELLEKSIYRIELTRSNIDEGTSLPFGVAIEGQLFSGKYESALDVFCSSIEWGSVADKSGLREEDELLMINGIPVADLDLMFVECLLQEATSLRLVVRSSRASHPKNAILLDKATWQPDGDDDDFEDANNERQGKKLQSSYDDNGLFGASGGSQIISDEYLTSLVCPPPPTHSDAFLRSDQRLLRQRSDLCSMNRIGDDGDDQEDYLEKVEVSKISKSKSQHKLDSSYIPPTDGDHIISDAKAPTITDACNLARQLMQRTERLTRLLGIESIYKESQESSFNDRQKVAEVDKSESKISGNIEQTANNIRTHEVKLERLRKSVLELLETEYAYVKQLETINDHYMAPMKESNFLNIADLKLFNESLTAVLSFQHDFFRGLIRELAAVNHHDKCEDFDKFNMIIQQLEDRNTGDDILRSMLKAIVKFFKAEVENFKLYAKYCVAYSKLQKILHPKSVNSFSLPASSITFIPNTLNTFSTSLVPSLGNLNTHRDQHFPTRQSFKTFAASEPNVQLKQLTEFLSALDSSSSSISFSSLARSSSSTIAGEASPRDKGHSEKNQRDKFADTASANPKDDGLCLTSGSSELHSSSHLKNVHQQNFESYLIKPIQRIVKYPMLLDSIASSSQSLWSDDNSDEDLRLAVKQMEAVICHVNDSQRVHDEYGAALENIERICLPHNNGDQTIDVRNIISKTSSAHLGLLASGGQHQPPISLDISRLLYFGQVDWLNINEFTSKVKKSNLNLSQVLFVFKSCVVFICKEQTKLNRKRLSSLKSNDNIATNHTGNSMLNKSSQIIPSGLASKLFQKSNEQQYTEAIRYQALIPVKEVQVRSIPSESRNSNMTAETNNKSFYWELFQCSSSNSNSSLLTNKSVPGSVASGNVKRNSGNVDKNGRVYKLACQTNEERSAFLRKIRFIIRESVRNMSLPLARSPSSRSYNSKKLSSPTDLTSAAISASSSSNPSVARDLIPQQQRSANVETNSTGSCSQISDCQSQTDSSCALGPTGECSKGKPKTQLLDINNGNSGLHDNIKSVALVATMGPMQQ